MNGFERIDTTANRIRIAMDKEGMKQIDLVRSTGIDKGAMSSYLKGKYEPKQDVIYKLAKELNVSEMWLWGYNCPIERPTAKEIIEESKNILDKFNPKESELIDIFKDLNDSGQDKVIDYANDIHSNPLYNEDAQILNAARLRTDIKVTDEELAHDDDIMKGDDF